MDYTAESLSQHLNTKFTVKTEGVEGVELELVELELRKSQADEEAGMERFSTFFYGPANFFLPQPHVPSDPRRDGRDANLPGAAWSGSERNHIRGGL